MKCEIQACSLISKVLGKYVCGEATPSSEQTSCVLELWISQSLKLEQMAEYLKYLCMSLSDFTPIKYTLDLLLLACAECIFVK